MAVVYRRGDRDRADRFRGESMSRPILLDLFCGAGGAAMGYHRAGFDVIGVDHVPQPHYPFEFCQWDITRWWQDREHFGPFVLSDFAAIHASPPCQRWSPRTKNPERHPDLITPLRPLLIESGLPYVIENVPRAPLAGPVLCGSSFGLGVQRHRRFETSWPLMVPPCAHGGQPRRFQIYDHGHWYWSRVAHVAGDGGGKADAEWPAAMGIDWMDRAELVEAIPPAYTELIGWQLRAHLRMAA